MNTVRPKDLFEQVKFDAGVAPEFPLDFLSPPGREGADRPKVFFLGHYNDQVMPVRAVLANDFVHVEIREWGSSGETVEESRANFEAKIDHHAGELLLAAALSNRVLPAAPKESLAGRMTDLISRDRRPPYRGGLTRPQRQDPPDVAFFEHGGYLVGVDLKRGADKLVMPFRIEPEDWPDPTSGYFTWADYGLVALDNDFLFCGKVGEEGAVDVPALAWECNPDPAEEKNTVLVEADRATFLDRVKNALGDFLGRHTAQQLREGVTLTFRLRP